MPDDKYEKIWNDVWQHITADNIGADQINAFFTRLHPQAFSEGFLMLTADTDFIKKWVETNYLVVIKEALEDLYHKPFTVAIEVDDSQPNRSSSTSQPIPSLNREAQNTSPNIYTEEEAKTPKQETEEAKEKVTSFVSDYTFENFVVGPSNQLAYSMSVMVAENPGQKEFNPLFIYGKSGLGKTHLLRAIQNYVDSTFPHINTVFVDTMELVNDYSEAGITKNFNSFNQRYQNADMVFIDDVQYLQGKEGSINIVFQLLNSMKESGRQMVLSADRAPKHIDIDERSKTRFNSGGTCDIQPPETETKLGIIKKFINELREKNGFQLEIDPSVQNYIAQNSSSNIRELKSAITKIFLYGSTMEQNSVSIEEVSQILKDHFSGGSMKKLTVADIQKAVEHYFNISHADLVGKKRSADIAHARQVGIYLCRTMIDIPFESIGKEFNRNHATVMYSVTQIDQKQRESRELNEELEIIRQMIMEQ